jgi:Spy/CpxP family protein refolding chaperone
MRRHESRRLFWRKIMLIVRSLFVGGVFLCCVSTGWAQPATPPGGVPGGPPGGFGPPRPGEILPEFLKDQLNLTAEQKKKLGELQKDVEVNLARLLTAEQKKLLDEMSPGKGGFGFGPPGFGPPGFGPPGGGPPKGSKGGFGPMPGFGNGTSSSDVQKKIGATDEEWKVIGPKLQKVITARRTLNGEGGQVAGPFGGEATSNIVGQAQAELKAVLDEPKHTKADVDQTIEAVRQARVKAHADLDETRRDLARLLTPGQQAIMVSLGHLE